jgi:hypothetical protein
MSYNYPAKNRVRQGWMDFLPAHLSPETPVLYLPGKENLELNGYLQKGIRPAYIFGVEIEEYAHEIAKRHPDIWVLHGSLAEAIRLLDQKRTPKIRVVNMDFDGPALQYGGDTLLQVFKIFPPWPDGYLAVTSYAARDPAVMEFGRTCYRWFEAVLSPTPERPVPFETEYQEMVQRYATVKAWVGS